MISNLRERLGAIAARPVQKAVIKEAVCQVSDHRYAPVPFSKEGWREMTGLAGDANALFLDIESTGLAGAGTVAFLVGLGWVENGRFLVRQILMRDYDEETSALETLREHLERHDVLVTFNGKSFDVPMLTSRFEISRMRHVAWPKVHVDLVHIARRVYKLRLKQCKLTELEKHLLGFEREGDIPGSEIPARYFAFLKVKEMAMLEDILEHNREDIYSMHRLIGVLCDAFCAPDEQTHLEDVYSVGRALEKRSPDTAMRCYRVASVGALKEACSAAMIRLYKRDGDERAAYAVCQELMQEDVGGLSPYVEAAKLLEHRFRRCDQALEVVDRALARFAGQCEALEWEALLHRRRRLSQKAARRCR